MKKLPKISAMLTLAAGLLCPPAAFAQMELKREPEKPTADAWEFTRYGTHQPSLYTGAVNIDIPLYTYRDKDFEIPISLTYSSNGYKPSMQPGIVGMGWHLNAGGYITREVRGVPDDYHGGEDVSNPIFGIETLPEDYILNTIHTYHIPARPSSMTGAYSLFGAKKGEDMRPIDADMDVYSFSFMGHTGKFERKLRDETYRAYDTNDNCHQYKIVFEQGHTSDGRNGSQFVITTGDGYKYYFGDDAFGVVLSSEEPAEQAGTIYTERVFPNSVSISNEMFFPGTIVTWKLRQIIAPNGRSIIFNYSENNPDRRVVNSSPSSWSYHEVSTVADNYRGVSNVTKSKVSRLESIRVEGATPFITCQYTERRAASYVYGSVKDRLQHKMMHPLLERIECPQDTCELTYSDHAQQHNGKMPFLSTVSSSLLGTYSFEYDLPQDAVLPPSGTFAIDHWGYYSGAIGDTYTNYHDPTQLSALEDFEMGNYGEIPNNNRGSNFQNTRLGMLTKIVYPTGGYSLFEYEPRTYRHVVKRTEMKLYHQEMVVDNSLGCGGGVRVRKISNYTADGQKVDERAYRYVLEGDESSGTVLQYPRYQVGYRGMCGRYNLRVRYGSYSPIIGVNDIDMEHSRVEELLSDGGKNVYHFESYETCPDGQYADGEFDLVGFLRPSIQEVADYYMTDIPNRLYLHHLLSPPISRQAFRGRLLKKETFAKGKCVGSQTYAYRSFPFEERERTIFMAEGIKQAFDSLENRLMTASSTMQDGVEQQTEYTYNEYGQVEQVITRYPDGRLLGTRYTYPDRLNPVSEAQQAIVKFNHMNYPLTVERWENYPVTGGLAADVIVERIRIGYTVVKDGLLLVNVYPTTIEKLDLQSGLYYTDREYRYNKTGDMTEVKDANGICTSFVWDRFGPVMRIDNASNAAVEALDGCSKLFEGSSFIKAETIRKGLPNAAVSLYEYDDYGNLIAETEPSGKTTRYDYDGAQRLTRIRDDEWNPVKKYFYSTATQTNTVQQ